MPSLYTVFERTSTSRALQTKLLLFQVLVSTGQSFSRWPRPGLAWPPTSVIEMPMTDASRPMAPGCHQRVFCHSPVFLLSSRGAVGRKIRTEGHPQGVPHFAREGMHY